MNNAAIKKIVYFEKMVRYVCINDTQQRRACLADLAALRSEANEHRPYRELNAIVRGQA
jgi:hypothetical protein